MNRMNRIRQWIADLQDADLSGVDLREVDLHHAVSLEHMKLHGARGMPEWISQGIDDSGRYTQARLSEAITQGFKNLSKANLYKIYLREVDLSGADLSGADLSGAHLERTVLHDADLSGACMERTDLGKADLRRVCLTCLYHSSNFPGSEPDCQNDHVFSSD